MDLPIRRRPAHGVRVSTFAPTLVFLTVCTRGRQPWLAQENVHRALQITWRAATAWHVGRYVLMPDHLHLFCAPGSDGAVELDDWVRFWKSRFTRYHGRSDLRWHSGHWDTRVRRGTRYEEQWRYVRDNPVRAGLVPAADDWRYQGEIFHLDWW